MRADTLSQNFREYHIEESTVRQRAPHGVRWTTVMASAAWLEAVHDRSKCAPDAYVKHVADPGFEMTTSTLRFSGPTHEARIQLIYLLREFPQVSFQERAATEYEVSAADESILKELGSTPGWSLST